MSSAVSMICSRCGIGHTSAEFQIAKKDGCKFCGEHHFYSNNPHNRSKMKVKLQMEDRPLPDYLMW